MDKIPSFSVNHRLLKEGIYVSRIDHVGDEDVITYDIRVCAPSNAYVDTNIVGRAFHTIEHIGATYFRSKECSFSDKVIYFGPMGCLTGFYLILQGDHAMNVVWEETKKMFNKVLDTGIIPGATPGECGRCLFHSLSGAEDIATDYLKILEEGVSSERTQYPEGKVLFICAMQEEVEILLSKKSPFEKVVSVVGIGKVNAAVATNNLIEMHKPDHVVSFGFAGGIPRNGEFVEIKKGDLVCASSVFYHDVWCGEPYLHGQVQGCPSEFKCETNDRIMDFIKYATNVSPMMQIFGGSVATGDSFVTSKNEVFNIKRMNKNAVCVDMEAAAVAQVCFNKGVRFSAYKIISDMIGEDEQMEQYNKTVKNDKITDKNG